MRQSSIAGHGPAVKGTVHRFRACSTIRMVGVEGALHCMAVRMCMYYVVNPSTYIYIYKEELKTVVSELLACMQPNCHEIFTALWNPYCRLSSRGRRAQIRFTQGLCSKKTENDPPPLWLYGESTRFAHCYCGSAITEVPSWEFRFYDAP